jgi:hypothetical protein
VVKWRKSDGLHHALADIRALSRRCGLAWFACQEKADGNYLWNLEATPFRNRKGRVQLRISP